MCLSMPSDRHKALDGTWGERVLLRWFPAALVLVIASAWITIASIYVRAAVTLGRWPRLYRDDPKELPLGFHYEFVGYAVVAVFYGTATALIFGLLGLLAKSTRPPARVILGADVLSVALHLGVPLISWYLD